MPTRIPIKKTPSFHGYDLEPVRRWRLNHAMSGQAAITNPINRNIGSSRRMRAPVAS